MKSRSDYRRELVWAAEISAAYIIGKEKHMTRDEEIQFARYKEAVLRADNTITAQRKTIAALNVTLQTQRHLIDLLNEQVRRMDGQMEELRAAL
jgi:predicted RNase H-like nuclease (RuvC/YqgF family)